MQIKDENEIIKLNCDKCFANKVGTYKELFGDLLSLIGLPKMLCKCGGEISLRMTGTYK